MGENGDRLDPRRGRTGRIQFGLADTDWIWLPPAQPSSVPQMEMKLTQAPGWPPRLWVRPSVRLVLI